MLIGLRQIITTLFPECPNKTNYYDMDMLSMVALQLAYTNIHKITKLVAIAMVKGL